MVKAYDSRVIGRCHPVLALLLAVVIAATPARAQDVSSAAAELIQRREQLAPDDVAGRLELGIWCERNQLTWQAADLYRQLLEIQPGNDEAYQRLVRIADTQALPEDPQQLQEVRAAQRGFASMKSHASAHFLILYDTDDPFARNRAVLLEKAHDVFYSTFRRVDFRPLPLSRRLVCVLFANHDDYVAYTKGVDGADMGWAAGYYSTHTNRIVFFDERVSPQYQQVRQRMQELEKKADEQRQQIRTASQQSNFAIVTQAQRDLEMTTRELDWYRNRVESTAKEGNATKTVHEATHQLAFNCGLQRRGWAYPFWLAEGIATNFEPDDSSAPFGPLQPNPNRRASVMAMLDEDKLIPLEVAVSLTGPNATDLEELSRLYDQTWALFGFMFRYHREQLREYLDSFAKLPAGDRTPQQMKAQFAEHFGEIEAFEVQFRNYLKRMP